MLRLYILSLCALTVGTTRFMSLQAHESRVYLLRIKLDNLSEKTIQIVSIFSRLLPFCCRGKTLLLQTLIRTDCVVGAVVWQFTYQSPQLSCNFVRSTTESRLNSSCTARSKSPRVHAWQIWGVHSFLPIPLDCWSPKSTILPAELQQVRTCLPWKPAFL